MALLPAWALKASAAALTLLASAGSAAYVDGHLKNPSAPLRPAVVPAASRTFTIAGLEFTASAPPSGGKVHLEPSVQATDSQQPLTSTSVS